MRSQHDLLTARFIQIEKINNMSDDWYCATSFVNNLVRLEFEP